MSGPILALNVFFFVLSDTAYAVSAGCVLSIYWLDTGTKIDYSGSGSGATMALLRFLRRTCLVCVAALMLGQIVRPWFAAASMSGSDGFAANLALIPDILSSTHMGKVWYFGSVSLVALLAAAPFREYSIRSSRGVLFAVALVMIGCAKAASGHAAGEGDLNLSEFSMLLHVSATAIWAGTIMASGFIVVPDLAKFRDSPALWGYVRLLSGTVTWALLVILLSGIYTSYSELNGTPSALWSSSWGKILLGKIVFVALAIALGAMNRFRCVRRPPNNERAELMVRLLRAEGLVMIVILCLSGLLANAPPAMTQAQ